MANIVFILQCGSVGLATKSPEYRHLFAEMAHQNCIAKSLNKKELNYAQYKYKYFKISIKPRKSDQSCLNTSDSDACLRLYKWLKT